RADLVTGVQTCALPISAMVSLFVQPNTAHAEYSKVRPPAGRHEESVPGHGPPVVEDDADTFAVPIDLRRAGPRVHVDSLTPEYRVDHLARFRLLERQHPVQGLHHGHLDAE